MWWPTLVDRLWADFRPYGRKLFGNAFTWVEEAGSAQQTKGITAAGVEGIMIKALETNHRKNQDFTGKLAHVIAASARLTNSVQDAGKREGFQLSKPDHSS
jgi:hypothetical protein